MEAEIGQVSTLWQQNLAMSWMLRVTGMWHTEVSVLLVDPKKSLPRTMTSRAGTLCPPTSKHHRHHHGLSMLGSQGSAPRQIAAALSRPDPIATGKFLEPLLVFPVQVYLSSSIPLQLVTASSEQLQRSDRPHTFPPPSMVPRRWARYAV
ncbi:hypothetical protein ASPFODRAFT_38777 [Aspergillus luchuensis CBS 106.47]|uniref:Uncharacterized protein n=1 Tax=Aspergillus luchuensis (strain CBS 106.47) TaxID=1137211 RepID=A0A1M3TY45_ASPLC|nr:hypothetical protein ASPFODRAFT_38777 [Aspergillus luchuensis CBS 106.47]